MKDRKVSIILCDASVCLKDTININRIKKELLNNSLIAEVFVIKAPCKESMAGIPKVKGRRVLFAGCSLLEKKGYYDNLSSVVSTEKTNISTIDMKALVCGLYEKNRSREKNLIKKLLSCAAVLADKEPVEDAEITPYEKVLVYGSGLSGLQMALEMPDSIAMDIIEVPGEDISPGYFWETIVNPSIVVQMREQLEKKGNVDFISHDEIIGIMREDRGFVLLKKGGSISEYGVLVFAPERIENDFTGEGIFTLTTLYQSLRNNVTFRGTCVFLLNELTDTGPEVFTDVMNAALMLRKREYIEVFVVAQNIQVGFKGSEELYDECRKAGIIFIKYSEKCDVHNNFGTFTIKGIDSQTGSRFIFDKPETVVIPQKPVLSGTSLRFAGMACMTLPGNRYSQADSLWAIPNETDRTGVFVAGSARENLAWSSISDDIQACVFSVTEYLAKEARSVKEHIPVVDEEKCAYCLTCIRVCPYGAMVKDKEKRIAKVVAPACMACGICVGECPAEAIQLRNLKNTTVYESIGTLIK